MPALTGPALVAAGLLVLAGAQKLLDPTMTVGALRALRLPVVAHARPGGRRRRARPRRRRHRRRRRRSSGGLVAASYLAFGAFVAAALRSGTMIGSCGCFGREETPPHPLHLVLDLALAGLAGAVAVWSPEAPVDALGDAPGQGTVLVLLVGLALYLLHAAFVELPARPQGRVAHRRATATRFIEGRSPGSMRTSSTPKSNVRRTGSSPPRRPRACTHLNARSPRVRSHSGAPGKVTG